MAEYTVTVSYKNKDMENVGESIYPLETYLNNTSSEILRTIGKIENMVCTLEGSRQKSDWFQGTLIEFNSIRHRMLDIANAVKRLAENMRADGKPIAK